MSSEIKNFQTSFGPLSWVFFPVTFFGQPVIFFEKVPVTVLVLNVQNARAMMSTRDIISKSTRDTPVTILRKVSVTPKKLPVTNPI